MTTAERSYLVLTAVGPDRPGLIREVSSLVHHAGANLEDSRMAILGGEFALLLLVSGSSEVTTRIAEQVPALGERLGLKMMLKPTTKAALRGDFLAYRLRVSGLDRPGIVHRVTQALAGRSVNVASLESRLAYAPLSGTPMFILEVELQVPSELALSEFRKELTRVCEEENLDFLLDTGN